MADEDSGNPLVGAWRMESISGEPVPSDCSMAFTIRDDGITESTAYYDGVPNTNTGTWSADDTSITFQSEDGTEHFSYAVAGDTLTLSDPHEVIVFSRT